MISIIIPYRNAAPWIGRCADSLRQDGDFEILFVDDYSEDDSAQIVRENADSRFILAENQHACGVSGARNTGLDLATGEWVTFLDADDELLPGAYDTLTAVIRADKRANIHQLNHMRYYTRIDKTVMKYTNSAGVYGSARMPKMWFGVWNKIYRRDFLRCGIRFKEGLQYGEDGLFILECLAKDDYIHHASEKRAAVMHRFDNSNSLSHSKTPRMVVEYVRALEDFIMECADPSVTCAACDSLSELWCSDQYKTIFTEETS